MITRETDYWLAILSYPPSPLSRNPSSSTCAYNFLQAHQSPRRLAVNFGWPTSRPLSSVFSDEFSVFCFVFFFFNIFLLVAPLIIYLLPHWSITPFITIHHHSTYVSCSIAWLCNIIFLWGGFFPHFFSAFPSVFFFFSAFFVCTRYRSLPARDLFILAYLRIHGRFCQFMSLVPASSLHWSSHSTLAQK